MFDQHCESAYRFTNLTRTYAILHAADVLRIQFHTNIFIDDLLH